jgi:hypothetical protein
MSERGKILNVARKQQINDFAGLIYGTITPTDIDALIDYKNRAYILIEVKYGKAKLPFGQKLALERLVKDTENIKKSIAIVAEHYIHNTDQQIDISICNVREYFYKGQWRSPKDKITVKEAIDKFLKLNF